MTVMKDFVLTALAKLGVAVYRAGDLGHDPFRDLRRLSRSERPTIFDVGANLGQSVIRFRQAFPDPNIHSFEPAPKAFAVLKRRAAKLTNVILNEVALGSSPGRWEFFENSEWDLSSLLPAGPSCEGEVMDSYWIEVTTLDNYCSTNTVEMIDILKIDTQGFDLEVLRGGEQLIRDGRIRFVLMEVIFSDMYRQAATLDQIYRFMADHGFSLVTFYRPEYRNERANWTDALFAF